MHPEQLFKYHKIKKSSKEGNYTAMLHVYDALYLEEKNSSARPLTLRAAKPRGTGWLLFLKAPVSPDVNRESSPNIAFLRLLGES